MVKKNIREWKDGDSGTFSDGRTFRLSNVSAPEKHEPGHNMATSRSKRMVGAFDIVDVTTVGKDSFGRDLVEVKRRGRNINSLLEMKNKLFDIKPPK